MAKNSRTRAASGGRKTAKKKTTTTRSRRSNASSAKKRAPRAKRKRSRNVLENSQEILEFEGQGKQHARIKVFGIGGAGGNALNTMMESGLGGVEFVVGNTDAQALSHNRASIKVQLGTKVTGGLGCGAEPDRGRAAAMESRDRIREIIEGSDMVFVTAGMGGGTGTGAAPIVAEVARELGALTVGVVTKPFPFEGRVRSRNAEQGINELHEVVDTLITVPNQRLLALAGKGTAMKDAFKLADRVLLDAVRGISDLITVHGLINLDFADVRTVMNESGVAMMGTGMGRGEARAIDAAGDAISSPLLEDLSIEGAQGVLINVTGGSDMTLFEVNEASMLIHEAAHDDANIIFGAVIDDTMPDGELRVTVIATGLRESQGRSRSRRAPGQMRSDAGGRVTALRSNGKAASAEASRERGTDEAEVLKAGGSPVTVDAATSDGSAFVSPFLEDGRYDIPAFLRKRSGDDEDEDPEEPTFLRRAQD